MTMTLFLSFESLEVHLCALMRPSKVVDEEMQALPCWVSRFGGRRSARVMPLSCSLNACLTSARRFKSQLWMRDTALTGQRSMLAGVEIAIPDQGG